MNEQHRILWRRIAQGCVCRVAALAVFRWLCPLLLMPAATDDPLTWLRRRCLVGDESDDLGPGSCASQIDLHLCAAERHEVSMPLNKSRHSQLTVQLDHRRFLADVAFDDLITSHGDDAVTSNRKCFGTRVLLVERDDRPVAQDKVGCFPGRRTSQAHGRKDGNHGCQNPFHHLSPQ